MSNESDQVEKLIAALSSPLERTHGAFLGPHPVVRKFPGLDDAAYAALRDDIQVNGQRKAIGIYQGYIWDGRARYDACRDLGIVPKVWILRVRDPIIYLLQRHKNRFGLPQTAERTAALEVLRSVEDAEWLRQVKRRRDEWLKFARDEFRQSIKVARPCMACGLDREYSHAHHVVPLGLQYELGLDQAIQDHDWLCAVHHKMMHRLWSAVITPTNRNLNFDHEGLYQPEPKRSHARKAHELFENGYRLFASLGGVSQRRNWDMVRP